MGSDSSRARARVPTNNAAPIKLNMQMQFSVPTCYLVDEMKMVRSYKLYYIDAANEDTSIPRREAIGMKNGVKKTSGAESPSNQSP